MGAKGLAWFSSLLPELPKRYWTFVVASESGCWDWTYSVTKKGYGRAYVRNEGHRAFFASAHRVSYGAFHGAIGEGLVLDHLCRNRACVNPLHLEQVTNRTNILRGVGPCARHAVRKACPRGHPLTSVVRSGRTRRMCVECHRVQSTESARRMREQRRVQHG